MRFIMAETFILLGMSAFMTVSPFLLIVLLQKIHEYNILKIIYSKDVLDRSAEVYVYRVFRTEPRYFKYRFHMTEDGKWKYDPEFTNIKLRIGLFIMGYFGNVLAAFYVMDNCSWAFPRTADLIFTAFLWLLVTF